MKKKPSVTDQELNGIGDGSDQFKPGSIILLQLNMVPEDFTTESIINSTNCTNKENYIVQDKKIVFESICQVGKESLKALKGTDKNLDELMNHIWNNKHAVEQVKSLFNEFVYTNGYPYLIDTPPNIQTKVYCPDYIEFIYESIVLYLVDELRRIIFKIRVEENESSSNYSTSHTTKLQKTFIKLKSELVSTLITGKGAIIYDNIDKEQVIEILEQGVPAATKTEPLLKDDLLKFIQIMQRTLIYYVIDHTSGDNQIQYSITKRLPIFNTTSEQYRLYPMAYSLIGIAYDYLLNNLTATKVSPEREICAYPDCYNEFEKFGKGKYCYEHQDVKRKHIKAKSYAKSNKKKEKSNSN